mmetsp:Transcript_39801/g.40293  ORF Transcript_39801/g.40293 Transcript_39801/m.40293 type:complete len:215 (-) Transcript_39801:340-984(-)
MAEKIKDSPKRYPFNKTEVFMHHNHDCTLRDMEEMGARRILVTLRHPIERISSGISRRQEGHMTEKTPNALFLKYFGQKDVGPEEFVRALRNETDPLHEAALRITLGPNRQPFMLPVSEFYLANSLGLAEVEFLCLDTLDGDFEAAFQRWFPTTAAVLEDEHPHNHKSKISSGNTSTIFSRFSKESLAWFDKTYAKDIALVKKHCPEGYRKYWP